MGYNSRNTIPSLAGSLECTVQFSEDWTLVPEAFACTNLSLRHLAGHYRSLQVCNGIQRREHRDSIECLVA